MVQLYDDLNLQNPYGITLSIVLTRTVSTSCQADIIALTSASQLIRFAIQHPEQPRTR